MRIGSTPTSGLRKQSVTCRSRSRPALSARWRRGLGRDAHDWTFDRRPDRALFPQPSHSPAGATAGRGYCGTSDCVTADWSDRNWRGGFTSGCISIRCRNCWPPPTMARSVKFPESVKRELTAIRQSLTEQTWQRNRIPHAVQLQLWDENSVQQVPVAELLDLDTEFRSLAANATAATPALLLAARSATVSSALFRFPTCPSTARDAGLGGDRTSRSSRPGKVDGRHFVQWQTARLPRGPRSRRGLLSPLPGRSEAGCGKPSNGLELTAVRS